MSISRDIVVGTAGHIDHGKTALVRALTGVDTDRLPAEKQRGISIDLGFALMDSEDLRISFVDVPGHERFVRNMLAGATGIDLALLVVAADDSVMPQTREHLEILRLLGLKGGLVVLTKCDLVEPSWVDLVEQEVCELTADTFLQSATILRTSIVDETGIEALRSRLLDLCRSTPSPPDPGPFRMAIDRAFTLSGHGTIVTGTVMSGCASIGDELQWLPEGRTVRVRALQQHGRPADHVRRGARAAMNLAGLKHTEVARGQELATQDYLQPSRIVSVELHASPAALAPIRHRRTYRVHLGTLGATAKTALLTASELAPGETGLAQLYFSRPVCATYGQPFVLRSEGGSFTQGGGRVIEPTAQRIRRRERDRIQRLSALTSLSPEDRIAAHLGTRPATAWTFLDLCRETGVPLGEFSRALERLSLEGRLLELPLGAGRGLLIPRETVELLEQRVLRVLARLHEARRRHSTLLRTSLAAELPDIQSDALLAALVDRLTHQGKVVADARTIALAGFQPKLSQAERKLRERLLSACQEAALTPPFLPELARELAASPVILSELASILVAEGHLVGITPEFYLAVSAETRLRGIIGERLADGSGLTMAELRDLLGVTRKHAVPLGEYLDRIGVTRREGDTRRLHPDPDANASSSKRD